MGKLFILINGFLVERTKIGYSEIVNNGKKNYLLMLVLDFFRLLTSHSLLSTIDYRLNSYFPS